MEFLNPDIDLVKLANEKKHEYQTAAPFPNIVLHNFFNEVVLNKVLDEFPDLSVKKDIIQYDNHNEKKLAAKGEALFGNMTKALTHYLNSQPILEFLQELTGIQETLIPDPYFEGGGYHEIKPGGLLKIHADFNKNRLTKLDRRINLLVYLNKDWQESYGGHFELWDRDMTTSRKKILPVFNTIAIFSTTDFSYHGHPNPLTCPPDRSRKSLALYYYSNGRPSDEINQGHEEHGTLFKGRAGMEKDIQTEDSLTIKSMIKDLIPPVIVKTIKKIMR
jgi:Rps23 Pro-64 3,4-dihydroxylase Tpa1-like proline 4-hydroxylase